MRYLAIAAFLQFVCVGQLLAIDDFISIAKILESGEAFHMHTVAMQGSVTSLKTGLSTHYYNGWDCGQNDSYSFFLDDSTGVIEVFVRGICGSPYRALQVQNGEHVSVQGTLYAYRSTDSTGRVTVNVLASQIARQ